MLRFRKLRPCYAFDTPPPTSVLVSEGISVVIAAMRNAVSDFPSSDSEAPRIAKLGQVQAIKSIFEI